MARLALTAALAGGALLAPAPSAYPAPDDDQAFFEDLAQQGIRFDYDKQICGSIRCEPLRDLMVQEGHAICTALGGEFARLAPLSVIQNLKVSPEEAHAIINASRHAYCPQAPDPYASGA